MILLRIFNSLLCFTALFCHLSFALGSDRVENGKTKKWVSHKKSGLSTEYPECFDVKALNAALKVDTLFMFTATEKYPSDLQGNGQSKLGKMAKV